MYLPLTQDELHHLPDVISAPRFATYLLACLNDREKALALYRWNLEISAAFMGPLHLCEIAIRNGISEALEAIHGSAWPWTQGFVRSLPSPSRGYNATRNVKQCSQRYPTTGKVVAELKFVFWEKMLTKRFDNNIWSQQFFTSFPGAPQQDGFETARDNCRSEIESLRLFRNRIAHHEPIFARTLHEDLDRIARLVKWRNPVAANWLANIEPVSVLISNRP